MRQKAPFLVNNTLPLIEREIQHLFFFIMNTQEND
jgi:hypothetical protein